MNKPFTHKITLALFFVIICSFTLKAQDTSKMILVVRPGQSASTTTKGTVAKSAPVSIKQQYNATPPPPAATIIPTRTAIYSTASDQPISMTSKNGLAHPSNAAASTNAPAKTGPSNSAGFSVPIKAPSVGIGLSVPSAAAKTRPSGYNAPTTSERTGQPSYLHTAPKAMTAQQAAAAAAARNNANKAPQTTPGNTVKNTTSVPAATTPAGNAALAPTTTGPAKDSVVKKDTLLAKKDTIAKKDSLIAKKDTTKKDSLLAKKDTSDTDSVGFLKRRIAFLEIGGPGLAISANYDMRVKIGQSKNFGFRAGAGYFQSGNNWVFTVPLQVNYLYGEDGKYLEFGLGTTFLISRGDNYSSKNFIFDKVTGFIPTGTIGVRYQPDNGKLNFRLGYVPIIDDDGFVNAGGFSIGYTF
jgi:hypothetical protein